MSSLSSFQSFSVPTSPAMTRSSRAQPMTPQRIPRQQQRHTQSFYRSPATPSTPYTPLSLRSNGSSISSTLTTPDNTSLGFKRRISFVNTSPEVVRSVHPSGGKDKSLADIAKNWRSRANENGIKVSSENLAQDESHYGDDEGSDRTLSDVGNDSAYIPSEEGLLPPPFLSPRKFGNNVTTRPRAQSHASLPSTRALPLSPTVSRNSNRSLVQYSPLRSKREITQPSNLMSTPPPNRTLAKQLKLKGSFTDPPHTRRREAFGVVRTQSQNIGNLNASMNINSKHDTSLDLFDIDENDFEYDCDYQHPEVEDNSFSLSLQAHNANAYGYPAYSQQLYQTFPAQPLSGDPFHTTGRGIDLGDIGGHVLTSISESVEQHFHATQNIVAEDPHRQSSRPYYSYGSHFHQPLPGLGHMYPKPAFVPLPASNVPSAVGNSVEACLPTPSADLPRIAPIARHNATTNVPGIPSPQPKEQPTDCSVCLASNPPTLAILKPCDHPLCSGCLTSALNIVGEKDMECAVCKKGVDDFKLVLGKPSGSSDFTSKNTQSGTGIESGTKKKESPLEGKSFLDSLFSSPGSSSALVSDTSSKHVGEAEFDFDLEFGVLRASTPKLEQSKEKNSQKTQTGQNEKRGSKRGDNNVVLRIDNVPWDITPSHIIKWLQQPVERVHVLLDSKGKTLSHAYVEVKDARIAGSILRGEIVTFSGSKKERGSVLGKGRRARGVTITRSGQEELMADLFPRWRGTFDGSRPSLAGLEGDRIIGALEVGLLTEGEISGLLHLIREPDSHFLKVPSLPFHSLISILSKFPSDIDSRVFWSAGIRDVLYDVTYAAVQVLVTRIYQAKSNPGNSPEDYSMEFLSDLVDTAMGCQAFTAQQVARFSELLDTCSISFPEGSCSRSESEPDSQTSGPKTPANFEAGPQNPSGEPFGDLAREFGVEAQLVQALAQRLAGLC